MSGSKQLCGHAARDRQTQRRVWPLYISRHLWLVRNVITVNQLAKCTATPLCEIPWYLPDFSCHSYPWSIIAFSALTLLVRHEEEHPFWCQLTQVVPEKRPLKGCLSVYLSVAVMFYYSHHACFIVNATSKLWRECISMKMFTITMIL